MCFELVLLSFFSSHEDTPIAVLNACSLMDLAGHSPPRTFPLSAGMFFSNLSRSDQVLFLFQRRQHHEHRTAFHFGRLFDFADVG